MHQTLKRFAEVEYGYDYKMSFLYVVILSPLDSGCSDRSSLSKPALDLCHEFSTLQWSINLLRATRWIIFENVGKR